MAVYVRLEGFKRTVNDTRSWKYYVFILVGLLILIPVALMLFNSVLKRNKTRILSTVSRSSQRSSMYRDYEKLETYGKAGDDNFDFLLFTQSYPITACICEESSTDKCHFAPDWEAWSIHGIWPSDNSTMGPNFCKQVKFDVNALDSIRNDLDIHWYSIQPYSNPKFWAHEWKKHGSCAEQLPTFDSELKYFSQGLAWNKQYNVNDMLEASGIVPDNTKTYKAEEFQNAVKAIISVKPVIACFLDQKTNATIINEIRLCFTKNNELECCEGLQELFENCPLDGVIYPKFDYLTERS